MPVERWTWNRRAHPRVEPIFFQPCTDLEWCGRLESAPADALVGKVLCVCAAAAIARDVVTARSAASPHEVDAVDLLFGWIDDPTEERCERISSLLFGEEWPPDSDPYGVTWWALRTATSSVGNFEAGWALETVCSAAMDAGFGPEHLHRIAEQELLSRQRWHDEV